MSPRARPALVLVALALLLLQLIQPAAARFVEPAPGRRPETPQKQKSDQMIVKVGADDPEAAGKTIASAAGLSYVVDLGNGYVVLKAENDPPRASTARLAIRAAANKAKVGQAPDTPLGLAVAAARVDFVEEDYIVQAQAEPSECPGTTCSGLWGMNAIKAPQAWKLITPDKVAPTSATVMGAVVDTGVQYSHVELDTQQMVRSLGRSYRFGSLNGDGSDDQGHGTHVSGTAAGEWGGKAGSIAGVNGRAAIASCKFLYSSGGYTSDAVLCLNYLVEKQAHFVINASWGGGGASSALLTAIQNVCTNGGLFIAAAGNEGVDIKGGSYPAYYAKEAPCVVPVAAVDSSLKLASFSNFGLDVPIAAPGVDIRSSVWSRKSTTAEATWSGTSMATPHVMGVALFLRNQFPLLNSTQVKLILIDSAAQGVVKPPDGSPARVIDGMRILDAEAAVLKAAQVAGVAL